MIACFGSGIAGLLPVSDRPLQLRSAAVFSTPVDFATPAREGHLGYAAAKGWSLSAPTSSRSSWNWGRQGQEGDERAVSPAGASSPIPLSVGQVLGGGEPVHAQVRPAFEDLHQGRRASAPGGTTMLLGTTALAPTVAPVTDAAHPGSPRYQNRPATRPRDRIPQGA